ncbi:hypothetical protein Psch_01424 [Pelotomaculum schinkii]|uniref:Uncharacterized protein n=1 Tax=Pelotomaculum schinkii TaxID=78350 RepID=A0A4Y7RGJ0_9FIRM|nr:hypothetical protein [Pelotomaculum schinkii]TEB07869.1 hypothetical protein Psch_01424 [Pelotomaculum schinkii]
MSLKTAELQENIKKAFNNAKDRAVKEIGKLQPEEVQDKIVEIENKVQDQLAQDLASAIESYIKSGDVVGIVTEGSVHVVTTGNASSQQGDADFTSTQVDTGKIQ